jgi:hemolysin III
VSWPPGADTVEVIEALARPSSSPFRLLDAPLGSPARPSWRGRLHLWAIAVSIPLVAVLAVLAGSARARFGVIVYGIGLGSMFATSTTYHRFVHTVRWRRRWRRADHAMIFAAIAGTFTPVCLATVDEPWGAVLLAGVWAGAIGGAVMKLVDWRHAHRVGAVLYLGLGWAGAVLVPAQLARGGLLPVALLLAGGLLYTVGAVGFGRQWPRLAPSVFSYHEVWHGFTIAAAGAHLAAIWLLVA